MAKKKFYANLEIAVYPQEPTHAATVQYVNDVIKSLVKIPVRAVLTEDIAFTYSDITQVLTADAVGVLTVDGIPTALNDRILVAKPTDKTENGVYKVTNPGGASDFATLIRADDFNTSALILPGSRIPVAEGTVNADTVWTLTTDASITLDTTELEFQLISLSGLRRFVYDYVGDGTLANITVPHGFNTHDTIIEVYELSGGIYSEVEAEIEATDVNYATVKFDTNVETGKAFKFVVLG